MAAGGKKKTSDPVSISASMTPSTDTAGSRKKKSAISNKDTPLCTDHRDGEDAENNGLSVDVNFREGDATANVSTHKEEKKPSSTQRQRKPSGGGGKKKVSSSARQHEEQESKNDVDTSPCDSTCTPSDGTSSLKVTEGKPPAKKKTATRATSKKIPTSRTVHIPPTNTSMPEECPEKLEHERDTAPLPIHPSVQDKLTVDETNAAAYNSSVQTSNKKSASSKTKFVFNAYDAAKQNLSQTATSDDENVIMKLNIQQHEQLDNDEGDDIDGFSQNNSFGPSAYDGLAHASFLSKPSAVHSVKEILSNQQPSLECKNNNTDFCLVSDGCNTVPQQQQHQHTVHHPHLRKVRLLMEFEEKNRANEWPANTNIHCYWCCHRFHNHPYGIPIKYVNNKFYVHGCFCSLECAAAYNFGSGGSVDEMWERYSLLNMMAYRLKEGLEETPGQDTNTKKTGLVSQAPHRLSLSIFGGHLSIEEFRTYCPSHRLTVINFPPMMTITQQIEEINDVDVRSTHRYVPIDNDRIDRYQKEIKLKRSKPLANKNNALICAMNIRYTNGEHPQ